MEGVAHATGSETAKEIHFSCDYIADSADRCADEIRGVLVHEVVHCIQYNGKDTCPSGLIEGIAGASIRPPSWVWDSSQTYISSDWVRLRAGLAPPHWRGKGDSWDAGYDGTAYFLQWLTERYGEGVVQELNELMKDAPYDESIFKTVTGRKVSKLWKLYKEHLGEGDGARATVDASIDSD